MIKNELDFGEVLRELQSDFMISNSKVRAEFESIINKAVSLLEGKDWAVGALDFISSEEQNELFQKICSGEDIEGDQVFDDFIDTIESIFWDLDMGDEQNEFDGGWRSHFNWEF